jgi:hypothetical protein
MRSLLSLALATAAALLLLRPCEATAASAVATVTTLTTTATTATKPLNEEEGWIEGRATWYQDNKRGACLLSF